MMKSRCKKTTPPKGKTKTRKERQKKVGFQRKEKSNPSPWNSIKKTTRRTDSEIIYTFVYLYYGKV